MRPPASWGEISKKNINFHKTRDCQSIAGFLFGKQVLQTAGAEPKDKRMKTNHQRVPTRFGPETRFEVKPGAPPPFRALQESELERLKNRLLTRFLGELEEPKLNSYVRRAANEAAALAWVTPYPLLVFPGLFEEKTGAAMVQAERQASVLQRSLDLLAV
jgi:hypothetical protein